MNFYIADTHFGHANIIRFDGRPFLDEEEMENVMVANWNKAVSDEDTVYILGDFCWNSTEEWIRILNKLSGHKVLIRGNHDPEDMPTELTGCFDDIRDYIEIEDTKRRVIMCHYPIPFYKKSHGKRSHMLCGHVHTTEENNHLEQMCRELREKRKYAEKPDSPLNRGQIYNVGVMMRWMDYTPRTLDEIVAGWNKVHGISAEDFPE